MICCQLEGRLGFNWLAELCNHPFPFLAFQVDLGMNVPFVLCCKHDKIFKKGII